MNGKKYEKLKDDILNTEEHANAAGGVSCHVRFCDVNKIFNYVEKLEDALGKAKEYFEYSRNAKSNYTLHTLRNEALTAITQVLNKE